MRRGPRWRRGFHQPVEIQLLDLGQAVAHVAKHRAARGSQGMGQAGRALARQVSVEVRQRGSFRVVGYVLHQPGGTRLVGADRAPGEQQVLGVRLAHPVRQQHRRGRREHAELHLWLPELRVAAGENRSAGQRDLEAAAEALAAHGHQDRRREGEHCEHQPVQRREHGPTAVRQVLLDAGAEAEVRPLGGEQHAAQPPGSGVRGQRGGQRGDHCRVDDVRLRARERQAQQCAVALERLLQRGGLAHVVTPCASLSAGWSRAADRPSSRRRRASGAAARSRPRGLPSCLR